ncbi:MAG: SGNH/GDSL hydrolase family protein [Vicinamibacterales bacterium]
MFPLRLFRPSLTLMALAALAGCDSVKQPIEPGPPGTTAVSYTALGASDAIGYGGSSPCVPFSTCPDGTGYVQIVARRLREANPGMRFLNLGIPGAVLSRDIMTLGNKVGRGIPANFIDGELPFIARDSTIVTVFADANGVNAVGAAIRQLTPADRAAYAQTQIQNFGRDFATFATGISDRAPSARIIVLNMPNLARLPYAAGYTEEERHWLRQLSNGFTAAMNSTRSSRVLIVDLMCYAPIYQGSLYSGDGFHPNDTGYRALADLVSAALATAPLAPPSSCSFMS